VSELILGEEASAWVARLAQAGTEQERLRLEAELLTGPSPEKPLQEGEREVSSEEAERLMSEIDEVDEEVPDGS